jgi:hypothetical protein
MEKETFKINGTTYTGRLLQETSKYYYDIEIPIRFRQHVYKEQTLIPTKETFLQLLNSRRPFLNRMYDMYVKQHITEMKKATILDLQDTLRQFKHIKKENCL